MQSTHENESALLHREIHEMQTKHEEDVTTIRTKLVATFKEDMHEMKTEWEEAFKRLKEESDTTQPAMSMELNDSARAKAEVETQLAEYCTMIEDERQRFAVNQQSEMEELKKSKKEEDLERLRRMYEEHLSQGGNQYATRGE